MPLPAPKSKPEAKGQEVKATILIHMTANNMSRHSVTLLPWTGNLWLLTTKKQQKRVHFKANQWSETSPGSSNIYLLSTLLIISNKFWSICWKSRLKIRWRPASRRLESGELFEQRNSGSKIKFSHKWEEFEKLSSIAGKNFEEKLLRVEIGFLLGQLPTQLNQKITLQNRTLLIPTQGPSLPAKTKHRSRLPVIRIWLIKTLILIGQENSKSLSS